LNPVLATMVAMAMAMGAGASGTPDAAILPDPGGCRLERMTNAPAGEGHFQFHGLSHDGARLLVGWFRGAETGAYLLDLATRGRRDLPGLDNGGVFSPDDARVLVAVRQADRSTELVELELSTGASRTIAPHPAADWLATYSPDGAWIAFNSYRSGRSDLYLVARDGGEPIRLTDGEQYEAQAEFAPDGRSLLFHREVAKGDYDVYRLDLETRRSAPFLAGPGEQSYAAWSPDGRWVAFASDAGEASGKTDIYLADAHGAPAARLTRASGYNAYPTWSPDGRHLYFNSERGGRRDVYRIEFAAPAACVRGD